jgi:hypothetical protein
MVSQRIRGRVMKHSAELKTTEILSIIKALEETTFYSRTNYQINKEIEQKLHEVIKRDLANREDVMRNDK